MGLRRKVLGRLSSFGGVGTDVFTFVLSEADYFLGTPTVTASLAGITVSEESVNSSETIVNGITYPVGRVLTFRLTATQSYVSAYCDLTIKYTTQLTGATRHHEGFTVHVTERIPVG